MHIVKRQLPAAAFANTPEEANKDLGDTEYRVAILILQRVQKTSVSEDTKILLEKAAQKFSPEKVRAILAQQSATTKQVVDLLFLNKSNDPEQIRKNDAARAIQTIEIECLQTPIPQITLGRIQACLNSEDLNIESALRRGLPEAIARDLAKHFSKGLPLEIYHYKLKMLQKPIDEIDIPLLSIILGTQLEERKVYLQAKKLLDMLPEIDPADVPIILAKNKHHLSTIYHNVMNTIISYQVEMMKHAHLPVEQIDAFASILDEELEIAFFHATFRTDADEPFSHRNVRENIQKTITSPENIAQMKHNIARELLALEE